MSSCLIEKYSDFQVIAIDFVKHERKKFTPIDIIYKPTKNAEITLLCYYTEDISKAYWSCYSATPRNVRHAFAVYEC